jgi:hypothetical protein
VDDIYVFITVTGPIPLLVDYKFSGIISPVIISLQYGVGVMVFNATFNNISAISWQSVLLVEETGENHRLTASH